MMFKLLWLILALIASSAWFSAEAQVGYTNTNSTYGVSGYNLGYSPPTVAASPPPVCSNQLDFSQACNSQYAAIGGMI